MKINMKELGLTSSLIEEASNYPELCVGRVISQYRDLYRVITERGDIKGEVSGKFRFEVRSPRDYPAVGDFVMVDRDNDDAGNGIIHAVLARKSVFIRRAAGTSNQEQVVASNIDIVFVCMSLNNDYNLRRLERYLSVAWDSGAIPVVVLTKADLCEDLPGRLSDLSSVVCGCDVLVSSGLTEDGLESLKGYMAPGKTVALIGSSGVGKSTLINGLAGSELLRTQGVRGDHKGRHTTTRRELVILPGGGIVIDTPGMRELGLDGLDLSRAFEDVEGLAVKCRFRDCSHNGEPGCAVRKAMDEGSLSPDRFASYMKLKREAKYEGLNSKQIEAEKNSSMYKEVGGIKNARKLAKSKNKFRG
ncbi:MULTISPECIES: ribosome small subunit-dependent GTPase A [Dethiosulfovibrio]|jgi:ribosome biogenesis GTPase|uniref:Small ribosomal subunit biogenesis GTPase RsgA n=2 Tax=Dethiosulfovibrio TaxID=47054 RepID=A0ABS9EQZ7_9BACT|nr:MULTISPECIES: ribosome small subunit-dependent GTPase A [Dethiosulfovibrio]MCF4114393.1 ribosome small subunit-dependent GTPase A [Dethiosulfovibrio russensis]MCF4142946.1 ribosome small subunit-dependent GTPase A [Dethiosulfovibrio marinus]MCF4145043.1 ribosome small subunit-dependent GTPase A [Dethiosulfovibrio acidaminovorans]